jgi:hypothetical protein
VAGCFMILVKCNFLFMLFFIVLCNMHTWVYGNCEYCIIQLSAYSSGPVKSPAMGLAAWWPGRLFKPQSTEESLV